MTCWSHTADISQTYLLSNPSLFLSFLLPSIPRGCPPGAPIATGCSGSCIVTCCPSTSLPHRTIQDPIGSLQAHPAWQVFEVKSWNVPFPTASLMGWPGLAFQRHLTAQEEVFFSLPWHIQIWCVQKLSLGQTHGWEHTKEDWEQKWGKDVLGGKLDEQTS